MLDALPMTGTPMSAEGRDTRKAGSSGRKSGAARWARPFPYELDVLDILPPRIPPPAVPMTCRPIRREAPPTAAKS